MRKIVETRKSTEAQKGHPLQLTISATSILFCTFPFYTIAFPFYPTILRTASILINVHLYACATPASMLISRFAIRNTVGYT